MLTESHGVRGVAFVGNYLPRVCGIATFTSDLCENIAKEIGNDNKTFAVAMNDTPEGYSYPERVKFDVMQNSIRDYVRAAEYINYSDIEVVSLQHEYGIFGGEQGSYILTMLKELRVPVVATFHTVMKQPLFPIQRTILSEIAKLVDRIVVMNPLACDILEEEYSIPRNKVTVIPHGIHDVPFIDPNFYKDKFNVEGKQVLLTFGLLHEGKGIEYMIEAMPDIVEKHPDVVYIVLGATHPNIVRKYGEAYRTSLQLLAKKLGVSDNVIFVNRFIELEELKEFLGVADIYITPYLGMDQMTSGTLAYALGAGKAIVSTPYWHAKNLLDKGRGVLTPPQDSKKLAESVIRLLDNPVETNRMRKVAYNYGRQMIWRQISRDYINIFRNVLETHKEKQSTISEFLSPKEIPDVNFSHIKRMTTDVGILRYCNYNIPEYKYGYTLFNNAQALCVTSKYYRLHKDTKIQSMITKYLSFIGWAQRDDGDFRDNLDFQLNWRKEKCDDDAYGCAIWALGYLVAFGKNETRAYARYRFDKAVNARENLNMLGTAYTMLGIHYYLNEFPGTRAMKQRCETLADSLMKQYNENATEQWQWFENKLSFEHAVIPQALLLTYKTTGKKKYMETGINAIDFLFNIALIDNNISFSKSITKENYLSGYPRTEQSPIDACRMIEAAKVAYQVTEDEKYKKWMRTAFYWFLGLNDSNRPLYEFSSGGCYDSLSTHGLNNNQGAESLLSFLLSLMSITEISGMVKSKHLESKK